MTEFNTAVDICNVGLQKIGARQIDPTLGFSEDSVAATECFSVYGKIRRTELRRNVWRFATRRSVLRPLDQNTLLLKPTLWQSGVTYFPGSIVTDQFGTAWVSNTTDNTGQPGVDVSWDFYNGTLAVALYNSVVVPGSSFTPNGAIPTVITNPIVPPLAYFVGELVYLTAGDGTYKVYLSRVNSNTDNPGAPTLWQNNQTYVKDDVVTFFPNWSSGTTYTVGQGVTFTDGNTYTSLTNGNVNHPPSSSAVFWQLFPQPIVEWNPKQVYNVGNIIDFAGTLYQSLTNGHVGPVTPANDGNWILVSLGVSYMSLVDLNINQEPDLNTAALWSPLITYAIGNQVRGSDGLLYTSLANANLNHDPTFSPAFWSTTGKSVQWNSSFVGGTGSNKWRLVTSPSGVALQSFNLTNPIGVGPTVQTQTHNLFRLPANYLREAPQDPKAGSTNFLGAPSGLAYNDWEYEGNFLVSRESRPIVYRFVADVSYVPDMDDMFCHGLGYRIAYETCERITQSTEKKSAALQAYTHFMTEARMVNGIETGPTEPAEDDYITCRL